MKKREHRCSSVANNLRKPKSTKFQSLLINFVWLNDNKSEKKSKWSIREIAMLRRHCSVLEMRGTPHSSTPCMPTCAVLGTGRRRRELAVPVPKQPPIKARNHHHHAYTGGTGKKTTKSVKGTRFALLDRRQPELSESDAKTSSQSKHSPSSR